VFCSRDQTIYHPFFEWLYAKFLWWAIHLVLGLKSPLNVMDMFRDRHKQKGRSNKTLLLTGGAAICWTLVRNDMVFEKCQPKSLLQILFKRMHCL
jgi:hypothetical protein